jgi:hypothetical protein
MSPSFTNWPKWPLPWSTRFELSFWFGVWKFRFACFACSFCCASHSQATKIMCLHDLLPNLARELLCRFIFIPCFLLGSNTGQNKKHMQGTREGYCNYLKLVLKYLEQRLWSKGRACPLLASSKLNQIDSILLLLI